MTLIKHKESILNLFRCQQSGNCCKASGYVYVTNNNIKEMATTLNISVELFLKQFVINIDGWQVIASPTFRTNCFLNSDQKCEVYENRPNACKTYPNWPSIWESDESLIEESKQCPGLKQAILSFRPKIT
jgi:Fe-S-cluster containining protein